MCSDDDCAEKNFLLHFSVTRMDSRGTFVLRTASNTCFVRLVGKPGTVIRHKLLELDRSIILDLVEWNQVSMVCDQKSGLPY